MVKLSAMRTKGAAGPSGIDASSWRRFCTDRNSPGVSERDLLALPTSMGGLGLPKPSMIAKMQFSFSTTTFNRPFERAIVC